MCSNNNGISVVIATKGRIKLLEELLESLDVARGNFAHPSEVILVDDSNESDSAQLDRIADKHDARIVKFGPSVPQKRNRGVQESQYSIVLMLDSDCLATPHLLEEHYIEYGDPRVNAVAGLLEFVGPDTWFWKAVANSQFVVCFDFPRWMQTVPWTPTANCSVRRDVFLAVGGFDPYFPNKPGGEDVDLGLRITKGKSQMKCNPDALVYHQKKTWIPVKAMIKRLWNYGSADCYLMEKHPDLLESHVMRRTVLNAAMVLFFILAAIICSPVIVAEIPFFLVVDLLFSSFAMQKYEGRKVSLFQQMAIQLLVADNELGFVWRCLRRKHPSYLWRQLIYFDGQLYGTVDRFAMLAMAHSGSIAASVLLLFLIVLA